MKCYFFATFNPIHKGHLLIAKKVKELFNFEDIVFVPAYCPPHKVNDLAPFVDRLNMLKLCAENYTISDIESKLNVPSYSYRTIEKLYTGEKLPFIIGYDEFFKIESWKNPEILREKLKFIVIKRRFKNGQILGDRALEYFKNKNWEFIVADIDFIDISASEIRDKIRKNQDTDDILDEKVRNYIDENGLYKIASQREFKF